MARKPRTPETPVSAVMTPRLDVPRTYCDPHDAACARMLSCRRFSDGQQMVVNGYDQLLLSKIQDPRLAMKSVVEPGRHHSRNDEARG